MHQREFSSSRGKLIILSNATVPEMELSDIEKQHLSDIAPTEAKLTC